jgi:hypothetical protein
VSTEIADSLTEAVVALGGGVDAVAGGVDLRFGCFDGGAVPEHAVQAAERF